MRQDDPNLVSVNKKLNILLILLFGNILFELALTIYLDQRDVSPSGPSTVNESRVSPLDVLRYQYGRKLYSQFDEETLIRHFFKDMRGGFFLDVGASDCRANSTTFYLEERLGWKGIAIDANPLYKEGYDRYRPQTKFFSFFVGDRSDGDTDFYFHPQSPSTGSGKQELVSAFASAQKSSSDMQKLRVPNTTLNKLLDQEHMTTIDFLSIDIEGAEVSALAGFDIRRFRPKLVCIEFGHSAREEIEDYFHKNDYKKIEKYLPLDLHNWYFTPR